MDIDDPVQILFRDKEIGLGVIAQEPVRGQIRVKIDGNDLFEILAPADWFSPTPAGGHLLRLPRHSAWKEA